MVIKHSQTLVSGVGTWEVWKKGWKHCGWRPSSAEWNLVKTGQILVKPWSNLSKTSQTYYFMVTKHSQTLVSRLGTWEVWKKGWKHRGWRPPNAEWNLVKTGQIPVKHWSNVSKTSQKYYFIVTQHSQALISGVGTWEVWKKGWKHRGWRPSRAEWNLVKTGQILVKPWSYLSQTSQTYYFMVLNHSQTLVSGVGTWEVWKKGWKHRGWRPSNAEWNLVKTGQILVKPWSNLSQTSQTYYFMVTQHSQTLISGVGTWEVWKKGWKHRGDAHRGPSGIGSKQAKFWSNLGHI